MALGAEISLAMTLTRLALHFSERFGANEAGKDKNPLAVQGGSAICAKAGLGYWVGGQIHNLIKRHIHVLKLA